MYQLSHRRLDKKEVAKITIGYYIENIKRNRGGSIKISLTFYNHSIITAYIGLHNENKRNQFQEKLNCVRKAWALVKERLKDHSMI